MKKELKIFSTQFIKNNKTNDDHFMARSLLKKKEDFYETYFDPIRNWFDKYPKKVTDKKELKNQLESKCDRAHTSGVAELLFYNFCLQRHIKLEPINKMKEATLDFKLNQKETSVYLDVKVLFDSEKEEKQTNHVRDGITILPNELGEWDISRLKWKLSKDGDYSNQIQKANLDSKAKSGIVLFNWSKSGKLSISEEFYCTREMLLKEIPGWDLSERLDFLLYTKHNWSKANGFTINVGESILFYRDDCIRQMFSVFPSYHLKLKQFIQGDNEEKRVF